MFVGIAGVIGAGKSNLARKLSAVLGAHLLEEPVEENPYLEDYYADPPRHAFGMQVYLLGARYPLHQEAIWGRGITIQDRTVYEDTVFAKVQRDLGYLSERDWKTYLAMFRRMSWTMARPDKIFYLDVPVWVAMERIAQRGRVAERRIPVEYMTALRGAYELWAADPDHGLPIERVDWSRYGDVDELAEKVRALPEAGRRWGTHI